VLSVNYTVINITGGDDVKSPNMNCTYEVMISGKKTENDAAIRIEELKGTSKLVTSPAPGNVYLNFNVLAGSRQDKS
jgi:PGF-pre-PGF domain-containing protein